VVLPTDFDNPVTDGERRKMLVTQWGADPIWTGDTVGKVTTAAPMPDDFPLGVRKSPLPDMEIPGYPPEEREVPSQANGLLETSNLKPAGTNEKVLIAPHAVAFDAERGLWYADIVIRPKQAYFPFVRLALARYQPASIPGAHLSSVALTEFQQLTADRLATVSDRSRRGTMVKKVSVYGVGPRAPRRGARSNREHAIGGVVEVEVQRLPQGADPDLGWVTLQMPPVPPPLSVRHVRQPSVQRGNISAARKGMLIEKGERLVAEQRYAELLRSPDILRWFLPPLIDEREVAIPKPQQDSDGMRLLVTESEVYPGEKGEPSRRRIVYAEAIPL